ncbi:MAG: lysine 2,3-aminomutase [Candidatus Andersenbacteria bacterium RIFCSPHIGHO2_12_FULL_45_11b]|uniref:Lysine 2,3-aminomutase n=2 Tax=Parcubacteria group TaxID=1794811 RepID=A0A1G2FTZ2_9BACT|nr:MAG: lysine 2,3-aminomutase [Candidatus Andersenbacteria bacterium RIFCSPHIGHO2_12_FULL_45_11b]OGZ41574.1 MAG: lysine 2,3-aminomutase [Candidatus Ryanbacteria bacterium RIFCSPHIGHO2_01_45_13]
MSLQIYAGDSGFKAFATAIDLVGKEKDDREKLLRDSFMPFKVTDYYTQLIAGTAEPYRTQLLNIVLPPTGPKPFVGRFDPYGNKHYRDQDNAFIQHKYEKTMLLHIDDACIANCQFCYKVNEIRTEGTSPRQYGDKLRTAKEYLKSHPEIDNVLFTGGDPAAFRRTEDLIKLIGGLIEEPNIRIVRFATKGLVYDPARFRDPDLLRFFAEVNSRPSKQVSVIAQINHPAEISDEVAQTLVAIQMTGTQVRGQPAILRGVNDSVATLIDLQRRFVDHKIISYYLTVFMPVRGVEQYALRLHDAFKSVAESKKHLSGLEKKGVLLASHDFGKMEICGFLPSINDPQQIVLKWHQSAMPQYLPEALKRKVPINPEDIMCLRYDPESMYCIDHVFAANDLPHFNSKSEFVD